MNVEMGLPSPKTPSMKRIFQMASPKIIEVPRTPRSEGFRRRKCTLDSSYRGDHSPSSKPFWNSDTPPMSDSSDIVSKRRKEVIHDPTTETKKSMIISEKQFYSGSSNRKCLLPLLNTTASPSATIRVNQPKKTSTKRKRSKSLDHRKMSEAAKLNKNIGHKIKRPKRMKPQQAQKLSVTEKSETLHPLTLPNATDNLGQTDFDSKTSLLNKNVKTKLSEKKISVNVNRMVRVNVQGGELRFTKHIRSPRKTPTSVKKEKMDLHNDTSELSEDWLYNKVDNIIVNLNKENDISDVSSSINDSSLGDSTANLSTVFCELGVSELEVGLLSAESGAFAERLVLKIPTEEQGENSQLVAAKIEPLPQEGDSSMDDSVDKLFPVFYKTHQVKVSESPKTGSLNNYPKCSLLDKSTDGLEQLIIDAGQKSLGPSNCPECGFYYQIGDPDDERMHLMYHNSSKPATKHTGWKWERVAASYPDGRVVHVCPADPKPWWSKIELVLEKANKDLGISFGSQLSKHAHAYFYVSNMLILGCLIAEPIRVAYQMLESDRKELERLKEPGDECAMETPSFCSNTPVRGSRCGINRIWTCASERRRGIATKMLDAVRATFVYGHILKLNEIAFSDPTPMGMVLAVKYTNTPNFLVYKMMRD